MAATAGTDGLIDQQFVAFFGEESVTDTKLERCLIAAGCDIFVSNSCHSGDQKVTTNLPFAGRFVQSGQRAAVVSRGAVKEKDATILFTTFYRELASGATLIDAHIRAVAAGALHHKNSRDQHSTALLQPILWLSALDIGKVPVCGPPTQPDPARVLGAAYLHASAVDGTVQRVLAACEDELASGHGMPKLIFKDPDLSPESTGIIAVALSRALGTSSGRVTYSITQLIIPPLTTSERVALVRELFETDSPLLDILAVLVSGDIVAMATAAVLSGRQPAIALLRSVEFGTFVDDDNPRFTQRRRVAKQILSLFPDDVVLRTFLAMPLMSVAAEGALAKILIPCAHQAMFTNDGQPLPRLRLMRNGSELFIQPDHSVREAARALTPAHQASKVVLTSRSLGLADISKTGWGTEAAWVVASWLPAAVAARQMGEFNGWALTVCVTLVGSVDQRAATELALAMQTGLDGWKPISPDFVPVWEELVRMLKESNAEHKGGFPLGNASVGELAEMAAGTPRERERNVAYFASREGDLDTALGIAVAMLATATPNNRFDYCESLHLLGDVQERLGRKQAALGWFNKERELDPPAYHRRLHNRRHMYETAKSLLPRDGDLLFTVAAEGAEIARDMKDPRAGGEFVELMLSAGLDAGREQWLRQALIMARDVCHVDDAKRALVEGYLVRNTEPDRAMRLLVVATRGAGTVAAHAYLLLSVLDSEQVEVHLRAGAAQLDGGEYALQCHEALFVYFLTTGDKLSLRNILEKSSDREVSQIVSHYARAALALSDEESDATERLADALICDGGKFLGLLARFGVSVDFLPPEAGVSAVQRIVRYLQNFDSLGEHISLPPLDAAQNLARLAGRFPAKYRRWIINTLLRCSEVAWDGSSQEHLAVAAALRSHACELLGDLPGDEAAATRAEQLGWLATLQRQRGRPTDAQRLFEEAILAGKGRLEPILLASLIGRYGNLLHDLGESAAAVHLQWAGICAGLPDEDLPAVLTPAGLAAALTSVGKEIRTSDQSRNWTILLVNLANCLSTAQEFDLVQQIFAWFDSWRTSVILEQDVTYLLASIQHNVGIWRHPKL